MKVNNKSLLVIRFSAMGDVALTIPVLLSILDNYPNKIRLTFVTCSFYASFIPPHPHLKVISIDLNQYKGLFGLIKLAKELEKKQQFNAVIDLHNVLRTKILFLFFKLKGYKTFAMNKSRKEKKKIIRHQSTVHLPHVTLKYLSVFEQAGYKAKIGTGPWIIPQEKEELTNYIAANGIFEKTNQWIGVAPFATHHPKVWGLDKTEKLIEKLTENGYSIFLFGGGKDEINQLSHLSKKHKNTFLVAGEMPFDQELALMKKLDLMVAMDSSNMHFASLVGTKVISIWGATTPLIGFYPLNNQNHMIQVPKRERHLLTLSTYGKKPPSNGYNWKDQISVNEVFEKIESLLPSSSI